MNPKPKREQAISVCGRCGDDEASHDTSPRCRYNGWTNYETWAMKLWIDNEESTYKEALTLAKQALQRTPLEHPYWTKDQCERFTLADHLKAWWDDSMPELSGPWSGLLTSAFQEIDWHEIAEAYLSEVK